MLPAHRMALLRQRASGVSNEEIAPALGVPNRTEIAGISLIFKRLRAEKRTRAATAARQAKARAPG